MGFISSIIGGLTGGGAKDVKKDIYKGFNYLKDNEQVNQAQTQGGQAGSMLSALLGLGGGPEARGEAMDAFHTFKDSAGYGFRMNEGMTAIEGSRAAGGVLNSGATSKELMKFGQNFASEELGNYMQMLGGMQGQGLQAAYNVGGAAAEAGAAAGAATRQGQGDAMSTAGGLLSAGLSFASGGIF